MREHDNSIHLHRIVAIENSVVEQSASITIEPTLPPM